MGEGAGLSVRFHLLTPEGQVPVPPVYTNCAAPPLPSPRRCHEVGAFVGTFVRSRPATERIALLATGGVSHWGGTPETGRINPHWDHRILYHAAPAGREPPPPPTPPRTERDGGQPRPAIPDSRPRLG